MVSTVKDTTGTEINSLLEIQSEVPNTQSPSVLIVPVSMISEPTVPTPVQESPLIDTATTLPHPFASITPFFSESSKKQTPTINLEQGSEKSASEILQIKREQAEKQQKPKFTIKSTNKAALEEYDLKRALYQSMHASKSFNRNPTKHQFYHTPMEALIEYESVMDKGVTETDKDHKNEAMLMMIDGRPPTGKNSAPKLVSLSGKGIQLKNHCYGGLDEAGDDVAHERYQPRTIASLNPRLLRLRIKIGSSNLQGLLLLILNETSVRSPGHQTVAADYFFNNDLEYLKTSDPEVTYTSFIKKTKATLYEIKGIEDMVPTLWSTIKHAYDKDSEKGIKHWGERRKLWYRSQVSKFNKHNVYSTKAILGVKSVSVKKLHGYGHLEEIVVKRFDQQFYKFKEGDFVDLHLNNIEDMLLLVVQHKLFHLEGSVIIDFIVALQIEFKEPYTPSYDPPGIVYEDLNKQKRVLRADELYKFSDGTLKSVRDEIHHKVLDFLLDYNTEMPKRKWTVVDRKRLGLMIELIDKKLREREIIKNLERLVGARELEMEYKLMTLVMDPVTQCTTLPSHSRAEAESSGGVANVVVVN
ncbi:hypothetical protein Tco_1048565 [Tanacetum coccineum]